MSIATITADINTARQMLAEGDTHRADQYAKSAHADAVELSFDSAYTEAAWGLMGQAEAITAQL